MKMANRHRTTKQNFTNRIHCKKCHEVLTRNDAQTGKVVRIQDEMFHVTCLKCTTCLRVLGVTPCHPAPSVGPSSYRCLDCHREATSPKCHACKQPTFEKCVSAFDAFWHEACFKCRGCNKPFKGQEYVVHEGCGYDEDCYYRLIARIVEPKQGELKE